MYFKNWFIAGLGILIGSSALSQGDHDYDGDSVLYTPVPKPNRQTPSTQDAVIGETQEQKKSPYFFMIKSGSIHGDRISFTTSIINGVTVIPKLRAGLGLGFDSYEDVSVVPLFVNSSWDLSKRKNALYLGFNGGLSKIWKYDNNNRSELKDFHGGYMINPEVGYRIKYHDLRLGISLGWKKQRLIFHYEYYNNGYWDPVLGWVQGEPNRTTVKKDLRRLAVNLFIGWK